MACQPVKIQLVLRKDLEGWAVPLKRSHHTQHDVRGCRRRGDLEEGAKEGAEGGGGRQEEGRLYIMFQSVRLSASQTAQREEHLEWYS